MGLAWQQGPLATGSVGQFLTEQPMPSRLLFAEPLRRRMRVRFADRWIADSEDVVLLHEPGRYPVAYFPRGDIDEGILIPEDRVTQHKDLGDTRWFTVTVAEQQANRSAWQHTGLPRHAAVLDGRLAFAWRAMEAFYEEDERIVGHAADAYHRIDIRSTSRHLVVRDGDDVIADTRQPLALYESGFAPRWYVPREDIHTSALKPAEGQTFCPYKGIAFYYDIGDRKRAAWSYLDAWTEVCRVSNLVSFEPDKIDVYLDGTQLRLEPGQTVIPHGVDRGLDTDEVLGKHQPWTPSVLVFDVNETLIDIESIAPLFGELFGDERVLREWFGQLVIYSMTATLADCYVDFFTLGQGRVAHAGRHPSGRDHRRRRRVVCKNRCARCRHTPMP